MKTINDFNFQDKKALIRVDFNVPLNDNFEVTDATRIVSAKPTIIKILEDGGSCILMSHLGRPKGVQDEFSLHHIENTVEDIFGVEVKIAKDCIGEEVQAMADALEPGEILLLENLRFHEEEKKGNIDFAEQLSKLGDIYVNDAFGTAHRAHASTTIVAQFFPESKCFGHLLAKEIESIDKVLNNNEKPVLAVLGGAKVSSKISIIENLLDKIDNLVIGGGMAYTFAKAKGGTVGSSLVEEDYLETARKVMAQADAKGVRILIPEDSVIADGFSNEANIKECATGEIPEGWMGLDIGKEATNHYRKCIEESKTILWNGPMGVFEFENFSEGTKQAAYAVVAATERGAYSLVGGGDSVAAVNKFNLKEHVSYVSTGGGALLELIEGKQLPGVVAIKG